MCWHTLCYSRLVLFAHTSVPSVFSVAYVDAVLQGAIYTCSPYHGTQYAIFKESGSLRFFTDHRCCWICHVGLQIICALCLFSSRSTFPGMYPLACRVVFRRSNSSARDYGSHIHMKPRQYVSSSLHASVWDEDVNRDVCQYSLICDTDH